MAQDLGEDAESGSDEEVGVRSTVYRPTTANGRLSPLACTTDEHEEPTRECSMKEC